VADAVASFLLDALVTRGVRGARVEHFGSTAVTDLPGKGVVDLLVLYPPGTLAATRETVDALGFQRQSTRDPWPEDRPMRLGAVVWDGRTYRLHVHVVAGDATEVAVVLGFRDQLRADAGLRAAYAARKREILAGGTHDTVAYSQAKAAFIESAS
jgi:GrpB-like predicted nucleotidyltransferase (UPF0157 family)